jgi:hypothetical protein
VAKRCSIQGCCREGRWLSACQVGRGHQRTITRQDGGGPMSSLHPQFTHASKGTPAGNCPTSGLSWARAFFLMNSSSTPMPTALLNALSETSAISGSLSARLLSRPNKPTSLSISTSPPSSSESSASECCFSTLWPMLTGLRRCSSLSRQLPHDRGLLRDLQGLLNLLARKDTSSSARATL